MKTYLVVGGTSGIGAAIVSQLNNKKAEVHIIARDKNKFNPVEKNTFHSIDVTKDSNEWPFIDELDGLVYCPGSIALKPFSALSVENYLSDFNINLIGAVRAIKQYLPSLRKSKGSIVLFSTVAVQCGMPFHASIASSKGAIEGLGRSLASELAGEVRVNVIAPSLTDTPLVKPFLSSEDKIAMAKKRNPMGKIGNPNQIANMATFLLSDNASWITGQIIHVDGGMGILKTL